MQSMQVAAVVDVRGQSFPTPLLEAGRAIKTVAPGDVIEIVSTCDRSAREVETWAWLAQHEMVERAQSGRTHRLFVRR